LLGLLFWRNKNRVVTVTVTMLLRTPSKTDICRNREFGRFFGLCFDAFEGLPPLIGQHVVAGAGFVHKLVGLQVFDAATRLHLVRLAVVQLPAHPGG
jgi:hypothetical protein